MTSANKLIFSQLKAKLKKEMKKCVTLAQTRSYIYSNTNYIFDKKIILS